MEEKIKELVLELRDIVRKQTKGFYPDVNKALKSLQDYVQETTASKSGLEDRLNELEDMLTEKSEKKKPFIDHIEKIGKALRAHRKATPKVTREKEEKRKPSSPPTSEMATPLPSQTKQTKTLSNPASPAPGGRVSHVQRQIIYVQPSRYELTQTDETTELSGTIEENEERDIRRLKTENQYLRKNLDGLHEYIIGGDEAALNEFKIPKHMKDSQSIVEVEANVKEVTQKYHETKMDISRLETENQYLKKTLDGLHEYIIGGDERALNELKKPKHMTDKQSIVEVEAKVKEVTQKFHETKTNAEHVTEESKCLFSTMECLISHAQGLSDGNTESDISSALIHSLDQIKSSVKKGSPANQFLTQAKEIIGIQMEWKRDLSASKQEMANKIKEYEQNYEKLKAEHQKLKTAYTTLEKRCNEDNALSEHAGALLTYENPSISDLSDPNRPTKLAERYLELYDCRWTDAFSNLSKKDPDISENNIIGYLYEMLVDSYRFCEDVRRKQILALEDILFDPAGGTKTNQRRQKEEMSQRFAKHLSDISNLSSNVTSENMAKAFVMEEKTKDKYRNMIKLGETYIRECVQLCWLMQVHTPPLCLDVKTIRGQSFDKNCYKEYRKRGKEIAFVVWPALFLHESGPLLSKGVAQGQ